MRFSTSARIFHGADNGGRSGFPVKIKEQEERERKREKEKERASLRESHGEERTGGEERTKKEREEERAGDRWSDFTLGLFSDGRRYETPSRACSNSGIPIPRFAKIVTLRPARGFLRKSDEDREARRDRGRKATPNPAADRPPPTVIALSELPSIPTRLIRHVVVSYPPPLPPPLNLDWSPLIVDRRPSRVRISRAAARSDERSAA